MPRFCRHNRFIDRCPICRETVANPAHPASETKRVPRARAGTAERRKPAPQTKAPGRQRTGLHVSHERRARDDGYRSPLAPGLRASEDAERLAGEIAFAQGRRLVLETDPPGLYREISEQPDGEQALWMCFLSAYLCPLGVADPQAREQARHVADGRAGGAGIVEGVGVGGAHLAGAQVERPDPFLGIRAALQTDWRAGELPDLDGVPLGPRTSHDPARGDATLGAYLQWAARAGSQMTAFLGDATWSPQRRFERVFERLTLPGLARMGRYELLVTLGCLGLCELRADTLWLGNAIGPGPGDLATTAAKRVFGIGEQHHLEHRARDLAGAIAVPIEALDLALANWGAGERATLGVPGEAADAQTLARAADALQF